MIIESQRFGAIELIATEVFTLLNGLPEHPACRHFAWLQNPADQFGAWLQSTDNPALAIRLMNPLACVPGYHLTIRREVLRILTADHPRHIAVYVPLESSGGSLTAQFDVPLLVHPAKRRGFHVSLPAMSEIEDLMNIGSTRTGQCFQPVPPTRWSAVPEFAGTQTEAVGAVKLV
ncbi:MAG: flagellar assembly protein FliW [Phycisphaerae bacterium]